MTLEAIRGNSDLAILPVRRRLAAMATDARTRAGSAGRIIVGNGYTGISPVRIGKQKIGIKVGVGRFAESRAAVTNSAGKIESQGVLIMTVIPVRPRGAVRSAEGSGMARGATGRFLNRAGGDMAANTAH